MAEASNGSAAEALLSSEFAEAVAFVRALKPGDGTAPSNDTMLRFYGAYKHATEGPCKSSAPPIWEVTARAKHAAWAAQRGGSSTDAKRQYIALLSSLAPGWRLAASNGAASSGAVSTAIEPARPLDEPVILSSPGSQQQSNGEAKPAAPQLTASSLPPVTPRHPAQRLTAAAAASAMERGSTSARPPVGTASRAGGIYADFTNMSAFSITALATPFTAAMGRVFGATTSGSAAAAPRSWPVPPPHFVSPTSPEADHASAAAAASAAGGAGDIRWSYSPLGVGDVVAGDGMIVDTSDLMDPGVANALEQVTMALSATKKPSQLRAMEHSLLQRIAEVTAAGSSSISASLFQPRAPAAERDALRKEALADLQLRLQATRAAAQLLAETSSAVDGRGGERRRLGSPASALPPRPTPHPPPRRSLFDAILALPFGTVLAWLKRRRLAGALVTALAVVLLMSLSAGGRARLAAFMRLFRCLGGPGRLIGS